MDSLDDKAWTVRQTGLSGTAMRARSAGKTWRTTVTFASLRANLNKAYSVRKCLTGESLYKSLSVQLRVAEDADLRGNDGASDKTLEAFREDIQNNIPKKVTAYCGRILRTNAAALQAAVP